MRLIVSLLTTVTVLALPLAAQNEPRRPRLPTDLDTNDARVYYTWAGQSKVSWRDAAAAFYWAMRLEPDEPDWLYARYLGLWYRQPAGWRQQYAEGAKFVVKTKEAKEIDSLFGEVLIRNPYPHFRRPCYLVEGLERQRDRTMVGLIHWDNGCYAQALEAFAQALTKDPSLLLLHVYRARGFYFLRRYDHTVAELNVLLDSLRAGEAEQLVHWYDSKEMFEYMIGMAERAAGRLPQAREAFGRALTENLSFYMAHARLGAIARYVGDRDQAVAEYELAVGLKPDDGALRHEYGEALLDAERFEEAESQLREASRLEPYWTQPYYDLGVALVRQEKNAEALAAFEAFLARCPRRLSVEANRARIQIKSVQERIAAAQ
jgi:Tfp pilus assembly protein PilF